MFLEDEENQEEIERLEKKVAFFESEISDSKKYIEELENEIDHLRFQLSAAEREQEPLQSNLKNALDHLEKMKHLTRGLPPP